MNMFPGAGGSQMPALPCPSCHSKGPTSPRHLYGGDGRGASPRAVVTIKWGDVCKELDMYLTLNGCLVTVSRSPYHINHRHSLEPCSILQTDCYLYEITFSKGFLLARHSPKNSMCTLNTFNSSKHPLVGTSTIVPILQIRKQRPYPVIPSIH